MRALLDVNVLIALLDAEHTSHYTASAWLNANWITGWASCPLTENGCLRIMTNQRYATPKSPDEVLTKLEIAKRDGHYEFWPDDLSITDSRIFDHSCLSGHQQITDIYLLALAVAHGGCFVTFDRHIRREAVAASAPENLVIL